ncbi:MAG: hypothetical protein II447_02280, partial [Bacteroidaceae bacterium]|nr:hypothetical protein [Bacteroidaceae bacterium]
RFKALRASFKFQEVLRKESRIITRLPSLDAWAKQPRIISEIICFICFFTTHIFGEIILIILISFLNINI